MKIHIKLNKAYRFRNKLNKLKSKPKDLSDELKLKIESHLAYAKNRIKILKGILCHEFTLHEGVRHLREESFCKKNIISVFDSTLSRTLNITPNTLTEDIIVVQTYFFDVLRDIILGGFIHNNERYVVFTASAGQIRTKKTVFIKESTLLKHQSSLMCGLTIDNINGSKENGVNINKFLAYLALCNSATEHWEDFNINRTIVVNDLETDVVAMVDYIDNDTYEIERKEMSIPITHTDGCGMILPRKSKKSFMVRLPWVKGLLIPFPFDKFPKKHRVIKDIYGQKHDIIKENIEVILTKSQFKMWKYYESWKDYQEKFISNKCQAAKCNEEEDIFADAKLNYQMLQTLDGMTDDELKIISQKTIYNISNIGTNKEVMLKVLGVVKANTNKNYLQQALDIYPELLTDTHSKEVLKDVKKSLVKRAKSGKLEINGKYTFIVPDLYAFCEYLFLNKKNPNGLLDDGEVYCSLYKNGVNLDCLRSPHLYREHAIRKNTIDNNKSKWFITNGIYTSVHDAISKILMFDVDGDKALVTPDKTIVDCAIRHMNGVVPLYYEMATAGKEMINNKSIYDGLNAAYTGGNIGEISNNISKIWNNSNINIDVVKWLCMENNFVIDYAKTLYKLKRPKDKSKLINTYARSKLPNFFIYAKDKEKNQVAEMNDSIVNRLGKIVPNERVKFNASNLGKLDYKMMMSNSEIIILDQNIIDKYHELNLQKRFMDIKKDNMFIYQDIRSEILKIHSDINIVADTLVRYLYVEKMSSRKETLWQSFGDVIVENLKRNLGKYKNCEDCAEEFFATRQRQIKCDNCHEKITREKARLRKIKERSGVTLRSIK